MEYLLVSWQNPNTFEQLNIGVIGYNEYQMVAKISSAPDRLVNAFSTFSQTRYNQSVDLLIRFLTEKDRRLNIDTFNESWVSFLHLFAQEIRFSQLDKNSELPIDHYYLQYILDINYNAALAMAKDGVLVSDCLCLINTYYDD